MRFYYLCGLFALIILTTRIQYTLLAPASVYHNTSNDNYLEDYEDYYDESETDRNNITADIVGTDATRPMPSSTVASTVLTTKKSKSLFSISQYFYPRSNHVVEPKCPKACLCLEYYKHILCNGAGLTKIPKNLPTTTLIIDLSQNNITDIYPENFINITKVREINLSGNQLTTINKEIFVGLKYLQRLRLADNKLTHLEPDTFSGSTDLSDLDLSNNSILLNENGSFLIQPSLRKFACRNCSWTQLYDNMFTGLGGLNSLNLDFNNFNKQINAKAFTPLQNIIKLRLPELEPEGVTELCNILKTIDNISFRNFDVSCFELVLGTSFNDSVTLVTDPPYIPPEITKVPEPVSTKVPKVAPTTIKKEKERQNKTTKSSAAKSTTLAAVDKQKEIKKEAVVSKMANVTSFSNLTLPTAATRIVNSEPMTTILTAGVLNISNDVTNRSAENTTVKSSVETDNSHHVNISQDTINLLLICIIIIAIVGIIIGIICRKDVGGIKTKCCRTKKPEPNDQVHPAEEIPLNKLDK